MLEMDKAFVFTYFPTETLLIDGSTYYYLSSNYFFTPQTGAININATIVINLIVLTYSTGFGFNNIFEK